MRNMFLVVKHEMASTLGKPSFWVMAFLFPACILLLNVGMQVVTNRTLQEAGITAPAAPAASDRPIGYVDQAGLIRKLPQSVPGGSLIAFVDEAGTQAALKTGKIERYAVIPANYLETGAVIAVEREFRPLGATPEGLFQYLIAYNLTGDETLTAALAEPLPGLQVHALAPKTGNEEDNAARAYLPFITIFVFSFLLRTRQETTSRSTGSACVVGWPPECGLIV